MQTFPSTIIRIKKQMPTLSRTRPILHAFHLLQLLLLPLAEHTDQLRFQYWQNKLKGIQFPLSFGQLYFIWFNFPSKSHANHIQDEKTTQHTNNACKLTRFRWNFNHQRYRGAFKFQPQLQGSTVLPRSVASAVSLCQWAINRPIHAIHPL